MSTDEEKRLAGIARVRKYQAENPEKVREQRARYAKKKRLIAMGVLAPDPPKVRKTPEEEKLRVANNSKRFRAARPERVREYAMRHLTKIRLSGDAELIEKHRLSVNAVSRKYRAAHPEKVLKCNQNYAQKSPRSVFSITLSQALRRKGGDLTVDDLVGMFAAQGGLCALSGVKMTWGAGKRTMTSISMDRIDNTMGYVRGNVRLVCWFANAFKGTMTDREMLAVAKRLVAHMSAAEEAKTAVQIAQETV